MPTEPRGHAELVRRLWGAARAGRLPHAILFEGPEGIGKFAAMRWLAAGLLCVEGPGDPCGACGPCKRVASGNHPDVFVIDPDENDHETIKVSYISHRENDSDPPRNGSLEEFLDLVAVEHGSRCVLLRHAHRMNTAAQNALLKTLEEPRPGVVLVLETHLTSALLPTIRSRCVRLRMLGLARAEVLDILVAHGVTEEEAELLARWSGGSPGRALLWRERGVVGVVDVLQAVAAGRLAPLSAAPRLWDLEGEFRGKTNAAKARARARFVLDVALAIAGDALRLVSGAPAEPLALGEEARVFASRSTGERARLLEHLFTCRRDVDRNLAPEAVMERALLAWAGDGAIVGAGRS